MNIIQKIQQIMAHPTRAIKLNSEVKGRWHKSRDGNYVCEECGTFMTPGAGMNGTPLCPNRNGCKYGV